MHEVSLAIFGGLHHVGQLFHEDVFGQEPEAAVWGDDQPRWVVHKLPGLSQPRSDLFRRFDLGVCHPDGAEHDGRLLEAGQQSLEVVAGLGVLDGHLGDAGLVQQLGYPDVVLLVSLFKT